MRFWSSGLSRLAARRRRTRFARYVGAGAILVYIVAFGVVPSAALSGSLRQIGSLVPTGSGEALGPVAVSGETVFAAAADTALDAQDQGAVLVFTKPAGAWSGTLRESAVLTASGPAAGDRLGESLSSSGQTVAVSSHNGTVYVFTEPASGWAGTVHQAATLTASDGATLGNPIISGQTIIAQGTTNNAPGAVYVFPKPPGGWSGSVDDSAKLTAADGTPGDGLGASIAFSGTTVVAGAPLAKVGSDYPGAVYVFTEPAGGWSGALHETAKLTGSDITTHNGPTSTATYFGSSVAMSGDAVVASLPLGPGVSAGAAYVFTEPAAGWASETQAAKLVVPDGVISAGSPIAGLGLSNHGVPMLAISGGTVVVPGSQGSNLTHPAEFVFTQPSGGWSGTQRESGTLVASDGAQLGSPVFTGQGVIAGALTGPSAQPAVADGAAYVFIEPAGGWSGTSTESAKLAGRTAAPPAGSENLFSEPSGGWSTAAPSAILSPSGNPGQVSFSAAAASDQSVVASGDGSAYVFSEPPGGWATAEPAARLLDSTGGQLGPVAISGGTIASLARASPNSASPAVDVFSEPTGGWAGQLPQTASLVASDGASFSAVAVSGQTVFAAAITEPGTWVYVFTEPAAGWSGTVHEAARLQLPTYTYIQRLTADGNAAAVNGAISGGTVVAASKAYVFTEPAGGWAGTVPVSAALSPPVWDLGTPGVYTEPQSGWSGVVLPAARLILGSPGGYPSEISISGTTVTIGAYQPPVSRYDFCPCAGGVWLFSEPSGGWHGILAAPPSVSTRTDGEGVAALAIHADSVFAGGLTTPQDYGSADTGVFAVTQPIFQSFIRPERPGVSHFHVSGLAIGKPTVSFTLAPGTYAPPLVSLRVALPPGLRFNHNANRLRRGIALKGGPPLTIRLIRGNLIVTLDELRGPGAIQTRPPALVESKALRSKAKWILHYDRSRRHHRKKALVLRVALRAVDAAGEHTQLLVTGRVP